MNDRRKHYWNVCRRSDISNFIFMQLFPEGNPVDNAHTALVFTFIAIVALAVALGSELNDL